MFHFRSIQSSDSRQSPFEPCSFLAERINHNDVAQRFSVLQGFEAAGFGGSPREEAKSEPTPKSRMQPPESADDEDSTVHLDWQCPSCGLGQEQDPIQCPECRAVVAVIEGRTPDTESTVGKPLEATGPTRAQHSTESKPADQSTLKLIRAAAEGNRQEVNRLLKKETDVNAHDHEGQTALMWAAMWGYIEIAKSLLDKGADVNVKTDEGESALTMARSMGHQEAVDLLLEHGAN